MPVSLNIAEHLGMTRRILETVKLDCCFDMIMHLESIELRMRDGIWKVSEKRCKITFGGFSFLATRSSQAV